MVLENVSALNICATITTYAHTLLRVIPNHFIANNWINCIYVPADNPKEANKLLQNRLSCCWWMHPALNKMNSERAAPMENQRAPSSLEAAEYVHVYRHLHNLTCTARNSTSVLHNPGI